MKTLLVIDNSITNKTSEGKDKIKKHETAPSVILSSLKWRLQSLDISINKVFKEFRNKHAGYWIEKSNIKVSKSAII